MEPANCPKCRATMEPGFVLDHNFDQNAQSTWVGGVPEASIWVGVRTYKKDRIPVMTYRCTGCGFLESYASTVVKQNTQTK